MRPSGLDSRPYRTTIVSHTTRALRGRERDGVDYHFVDDATFERLVAEGAFLEWAEVHGNRYGTAMSEATSDFKKGKSLASGERDFGRREQDLYIATWAFVLGDVASRIAQSVGAFRAARRSNAVLNRGPAARLPHRRISPFDLLRSEPRRRSRRRARDSGG